jgi:hypothetical protein
MKRFQLAVFGKQGCDKCVVLKKRLQKILEEKPYSCFEFNYFDMGTSEGLVRFCQCEILNPQRIPSFMVFRSGSEELSPVADRLEMPCNGEVIDTWLAMETDYSSGGVIKPAEIRKLLDKALQTLTVKA